MVRVIAAFFLILLAGPALAQEHAARTIVVELYTSQGCDSCPRANRLMGRLREEDGVIALTFPVDYWDYLGWRDTFAQPAFTSRQRAYVGALEGRGLFTPQFIFDGVRSEAGGRPDRLQELIEEVRAEPVEGPDIAVQRRGRYMRVFIGSGPAQAHPADVWVASYEPGPVWVDVSSGENAGLRVPHYNLVRRISRLGAWTGAPVAFNRTLCRPACAVLVQAPNGGPVLSAHFGPSPGGDS